MTTWPTEDLKQIAATDIVAAGQQREVDFAVPDHPDSALEAAIDEAYRAKYGSSAYLEPMISKRAKDATIRVTLRSSEA